MANLARIDGFITDENSKRIAIREAAHDVALSLAEASDLIGNARHYAMNQWKRLVLAERNKMNLVVHKKPLPLRVKHQGAVVRSKIAVRSGGGRIERRLPFNSSGDKR